MEIFVIGSLQEFSSEVFLIQHFKTTLLKKEVTLVPPITLILTIALRALVLKLVV